MKTLSSFSDLKSVGAKLKEEAELRLEEKRRAAERAARRRQEASLFSSAMSDMGVRPLKKEERADTGKRRPQPIPHQSIAERKAVLHASVSDEVDTLVFLQSEDGRCYWREGLSPDICRKLRRGDWTVQNHLDLHGLRTDAAREAVLEFLRSSQKAGARCVRIVHGKGNGSPGHQPVLKKKVRRWLKQCGTVMAFAEAPEIDGGAGAVLVLLSASPRTLSTGAPHL